MDTSDIELSNVQITKAIEENQMALALDKEKPQQRDELAPMVVQPDVQPQSAVVTILDDTPSGEITSETDENKQNIDDMDCDIVEDEEVTDFC